MASLQDFGEFTSLVEKSYPNVDHTATDMVKLSSSIFPNAQYSTAEKTEIEQWLITATHVATPTEDAAKTSERLSSLNTHLSTRTTLLGSKPSIADVALYSRLAPVAASWTPEQRTGEQGYHHIIRHLDFVQNASIFALKLSDSEKVSIDPANVIYKIKPIDPKAEKERKKREKELAAAAAGAGATITSAVPAEVLAQAQNAASTATSKAKNIVDQIASAVGAEGSVPKTKKEKAPKAPKPPKAAVEKPLSPCLIDLRVGHILKAINHPNADSLFVSTIACGDAPGTENTSEYEGQIVRTVCSGLNGLIPLEELQGRKIVAVCNLKPVTMRGIKSAAMVLCASPRIAEGGDPHAGPVEFVNLPSDAVAGERVYFEGWEGEPEGVLNPKKKVWETLQPGFTTTEQLEVGFDASGIEALKDGQTAAAATAGIGKLRTKSGLCSVKSLKHALVR